MYSQFHSGKASEDIAFGNRVVIAFDGTYRRYDSQCDYHALGIAVHDAVSGDDIEYMICGSEAQLLKRHMKHEGQNDGSS